MQFDPNDLDYTSVYKLITGCIIPGPIGWISTINKNIQKPEKIVKFYAYKKHFKSFICMKNRYLYSFILDCDCLILLNYY
jgi:hypothetical protein